MSTPADARRNWLRPQWWWPLLAGVLVGIVMRLLFSGAAGEHYEAMMASFILLAPVLVGAVTAYVAELTERRSWSYYFGMAAVANVLFIAGTFLILIEGLICAIIVSPLFAALGGVGGLIMGAVCRWTRWPRRAVSSFALLPALLGGVEHNLPLPARIDTVTRSHSVAAAPADVWAQLTNLHQIRPEELGDAWMYRIGVPLPESALTREANGEFVRRIRMGKGIRFDQFAAVWEPGKRVRWIYRFAPDSFPPQALDDHVRIGGEYFDVIDTEYVLEPNASGTVLHVSMSYRVSTRFNWYARPLAALLIGNFEQTALRLYAQRAEAAATL